MTPDAMVANRCEPTRVGRAGRAHPGRELELLYDANAYRCVATVQRVDPPVTVERTWQLAGVLDAWVRENGVWIGRVRGHDGRIVWIRGAELRQAGEGLMAERRGPVIRLQDGPGAG
jgi:hypothetical protein